jgi:hypothetical protein
VKLSILWLLTKFVAFYKTWRFVNVLKKNPPLVSILNQTIRIQIIPYYGSKYIWILFSHLCPGLQMVIFPSGIHAKTCMHFCCLMRATCPDQVTFLTFIILIILARCTNYEGTHYNIQEPGYLSLYSDWVRAGLPKGQSSSPGKVKIFSSPRRPERLWGPPNLLAIGYRGLFPRG